MPSFKLSFIITAPFLLLHYSNRPLPSTFIFRIEFFKAPLTTPKLYFRRRRGLSRSWKTRYI